MSKQKQKKPRRFYLNLTVSLSLILAVLLPVFTPSFVSADIAGVQAQQDRTILHALYRCLNPNNSPGPNSTSLNGPLNFLKSDYVTADDLRQDNMDAVVDQAWAEPAAVGYEVDSSDGNADCQGISLSRAMRPIGKNPRWFFELFYDFNHPNTGSDGTNYFPIRSGATLNTALTKIRNLMNSRDLGIGKPERLRRLAGAFWVCAEPAPDPPDRDTETIGGKKYQLRSDAPHEVSVGYDLEGDNGKFECNTLLHWGNKAEMAEALNGNPQGSTPGSVGGADPSGSLTDCDTKLLNPLSWIICPLIDIGSAASDYIFQNVAKPLLEDVPIELKPSDGAYSAWQGFRFLANIMIIGTMLVIVYVQAKGGPS